MMKTRAVVLERKSSMRFGECPSRLRLALCLLLTPGLLAGCYSAKISEPPRTAIEMLLLSEASEKAMKEADLSWLNGKKTYVEEKYFESYDKGQAISIIRQHLSQSGALLQNTNGNADVIVEIRSDGLGMNTSDLLVGIPTLTVPIPLSGPLQTPEVAIYKSQKADSVGKFGLFAYVRDTGAPAQTFGTFSGYAHFHLYKLLGVSWKSTDVPELKSRHSSGKK